MAQAWLNMTDGSVSPIIGAVFVYSASFVFGWISYNIVEKILPQTFHQLGFDCIKTLTICAYPFGHVLMWKFYGGTGFLGGMVPIMVFTILALPKGDGTPVAVWVNYFRGVLSLWTCLLKTIVMIFAAFAAYKLGIFLYQSKVHEHFTTKLKDNEAGVCPSALKVSLLQGFLIETLGLVYDAWFSTLKLSGNKVIDTLLKVTNTGIVVVAGECSAFVFVSLTIIKTTCKITSNNMTQLASLSWLLR